jgi:hypothetical protein
MRLTVSGFQGNGFTEVTAEHWGESLKFTTKIYSKVQLSEPQRIFKEINLYWETQKAVDLNIIWDCYKRIHEIMNMSLDPAKVTESISHYVGVMYKHMAMNGLRRWLTTIGNLFIPADVAQTTTSDSRYDPKQTYLEHEYINLATVSLALRPMIPIFGEYLESSSSLTTNKETEALGLMYECEVVNWPQNETGPTGELVESAFDKLEGYVQFCVDKEPTTLARLWGSKGTVDVPVHMRSKVLVRRLTIVPLDDPTSFSIVANSWRYVLSLIDPAARTTADRVADKKPESGGDDEDKTSFMEAHKTKHRVPPGDIVAFDSDTKDYQKLALKVDPTIDMKKLDQCITAMNKTLPLAINPHQIKLAQWVMAAAFPTRAFYHIKPISVKRLLATTQALLWHWGFIDIAVFLQVDLLKQGDSASQFQLGNTRTNSRIPTRYKEDLDKYYPHQKAPQYTGAGVPTNQENMASMAIATATASIHASNWVYKGPNALFKESGQVVGGPILVIPQTIKATLAELVIHLGRLNS